MPEANFANKVRPQTVRLASITGPVMEAALNVDIGDGQPLRFYREDSAELAKSGKEKELDRASTDVRIFLEQMASALLIEALSQATDKPIDVSGEIPYLSNKLRLTMKQWDRCSEAANIKSDAQYAEITRKVEIAMRQSLKDQKISRYTQVTPY